MKKNAATLFLSVLCLLLQMPAVPAETREGTIWLEGTEETIREMQFESPEGFSFWYANDALAAEFGTADDTDGAVVRNAYSDDYMVLSMISQEDAVRCAGDAGAGIAEQSASSRVQTDVYRELKDGRFRFLTLIAEGGRYLRASGAYSVEAADGIGKYFDRVLDSVSWIDTDDYDAEFLRELPGRWAEEYDEAGTVLTLEENGDMELYCYGLDGSFAYTCRGTWSYRSVPGYSGEMTLRFTSTDNPQKAGSGYGVDCVYAAYTESSVENDTLVTYLILNPPVSSSGVSPFEETYGYDGVSLHREQGPNMQVVKCKDFVSLRETSSKASKRLEKVPLGTRVLAFPEEGEKDGFIRCIYHDQEGYILSEYLQPAQ